MRSWRRLKCGSKAPYAFSGSVPLADEWIFDRLGSTIAIVNAALANYRFHEAAQVIYQFFWGDFCDWYIEWIKPDLLNADRERAAVSWKNLFAVFDAALRLLHPFMPFITEELWWQLPQAEGDKSIALKTYPEERATGGQATRVKEFMLAQEVISEVRNIRAEMKLDPRKKVAAEFYSSHEDLRSAIQRNMDGIQRLAILSELKVSAKPLASAGGAMRSTAQFDIQIAYSDVVDVAAESERLRKEIERLQKDIASKERQLGDETFRSRAPEKIIKGMQATLEERRIELGKSSERLQQLERGA